MVIVTAVLCCLVAIIVFAFCWAVNLLVYGTERALKLFGVYVEFCKWLRHRKEFTEWLNHRDGIRGAIKELDKL
jgi:hypothetical protein